MELTLIPIAAILVLLAGIASPAQPAREAMPSAALLSFWLTRDSLRPFMAPARHRSLGKVVVPRAEIRLMRDILSLAAQQRCRQLGRFLVRTRFGVIRGAYRSTAPPVQPLPHPAA